MGIKVSLRRGIPGRVPDAVVLGAYNQSSESPLVIVHGIARETDKIAQSIAPLAAASGRLIVLPIFDLDHWKTYQRPTSRVRADIALLRLLSALDTNSVMPRCRFDLAGFSGGAQFAHRFTWMYPHLVDRLTVASAGWWTFPNDAPFPYGMGTSQEGPTFAPMWLRNNLRAFLSRKITVCVGEEDNVVDRNTRSGAFIDAQQGRDRLTRAHRWAEALRESARAEQIPEQVGFEVLPGCGHDFAVCAKAGMAKIFLEGQSPAHACLPKLEGLSA